VSKLTGNKYLAEALHGYEVDYLFHMPTVLLPAFAEMEKFGITMVATHGEKAAAYMADGYSRVSNKVSVIAAQAVGAANLAAGMQEAFLANSPVLALTGGPTKDTRYRHFYQEIDAHSMFDSVTKFNVEVPHVDRLPDLLRQACRSATTGTPGPAHLQLPRHLAEMDDEVAVPDTHPRAEKEYIRHPAYRPEPDAQAVERALTILNAAERPLIVSGGGVVSSGAQADLVAFAERNNIPVATSMNGKGSIGETHPLAIGVTGLYTRLCANEIAAQADVVLFIGSQTGSQVTHSWKYPPLGRVRTIQINIDPAELGRNYPAEVGILGDARATLRRMTEWSSPPPVRSAWLETVQSLVANWRTKNEPRLTSDAVPIRPERLMREIQNSLPADGILVVDTGHAGMWGAAMFDIAPGQTFLRAAGSLGWAYPAALGAKCAAPDRTVVCFTGDGGFYYHLSEMETARRYGINTVTVVNNNFAHNQEYGTMNRAYRDEQTAAARRMWTFDPKVNFQAIARGFGCHAVRVERPEDIRPALEEAMNCGEPAIVEVITDIEAMADKAV
jgi:acetolactate synthase-1/2/3 large subunit